jgi:hypothetical protein
MSGNCRGCGKEPKDYAVFDRRGNPTTMGNMTNNNPPATPKEAVGSILSYDGTPLVEKTIDEALEDKRKRREFIEKQGNDLITNMTDDMKRLVIIDLLSVYNLEEFSMAYTSPNQALVALWKYVHHPAFQTILREFEGLAEEVDKRYEELRAKKINIGWGRK